MKILFFDLRPRIKSSFLFLVGVTALTHALGFSCHRGLTSVALPWQSHFKKKKCCFPLAALPLPRWGWISRRPPPSALIWEAAHLEGRGGTEHASMLLGKLFLSIVDPHCALPPVCLAHPSCGPARCRQRCLLSVAPCQLRKRSS